MRGPLHLRSLTEEEERVISKLARSQSASKRLVERAKIIQWAKEGQTIPQIMRQLHMSEPMVRKWWKRFEQQGVPGLEDAPRPGAPTGMPTSIPLSGVAVAAINLLAVPRSSRSR